MVYRRPGAIAALIRSSRSRSRPAYEPQAGSPRKAVNDGARGSAAEIGPWHRRGLTFRPNSLRAWIRLAVWELWMGMLLCGLLAFGMLLIVTSPDRIVIAEDLSHCYATTVVLPCERIVYSTGGLNAAFSVLCGCCCSSPPHGYCGISGAWPSPSRSPMIS